MFVPEPVPLPGKKITVNLFDHEKPDAAIANRRDADPDDASCRESGSGTELNTEH